MMFYNHATLLPENINYTFNPEKIEDLFLKSKNKTHPKDLKNFSFSSEFMHDLSKISIFLNTKINTLTLTLARIKLSTVPANCGSLFIHEMWMKYQKTGLGTLLLKKTEDWAINSGYTMIHCNVPNYNESDKTHKFFEKNGYKLMGDPYINVRSNNTNQWYYKILQQPSEDNEE